MIIPEFWAEARLQQPRKKGQSQITVRRFGWSLTSQLEAEQMAQTRAGEALQKIIAGKILLARSEPKRPYNGAEGVPIREEVLARHEAAVITRNSYGARCLNTPDVLFADVDFETGPRGRLIAACVVFVILLGALLTAWFRSRLVFGASVVSVFLLSYPLAAGLWKLKIFLRGGARQLAQKRLAAFVRSKPDWHLRVYATPAGLRVLVMHRTFRPDEPAATAFFSALGTDPVYVRMCRNQQCFRARVSPKPWRMKIATHIRPRPGVWPVQEAHRERRDRWIKDYESAAEGFASCQFLQSLGSKQIDPRARQVMELHDGLSQALSKKPIA